jgi:hypothetical protein
MPDSPGGHCSMSPGPTRDLQALERTLEFVTPLAAVGGRPARRRLDQRGYGRFLSVIGAEHFAGSARVGFGQSAAIIRRLANAIEPKPKVQDGGCRDIGRRLRIPLADGRCSDGRRRGTAAAGVDPCRFDRAAALNTAAERPIGRVDGPRAASQCLTRQAPFSRASWT